MTSIERGPGLSNVILGVASAAVVLIVAMFGFWEIHQESNRIADRQDEQNDFTMLSRTLERVYELEAMQATQLATLQQMEASDRRDIEREREKR